MMTVQTVAKARDTLKAYALLPSEMLDPTAEKVTPIIVVEGESGYYRTDYSWEKEYAEQTLQRCNEGLGLSKEMAHWLFIQSMFPLSKLKRPTS